MDTRIVSRKDRKVTMLEMSCRWIENRDQKNQEKVMKYDPLTPEIKSAVKDTLWNNTIS